jgi:sulfur-oxidizing protein SoxX
MRTSTRTLLLLGVLSLAAGCDTGPKGSLGFTLPDGDVEKGKANYVTFACHSCHDSTAVPQLKGSEPPALSVPLGGETTHIKSYGELVTSIINPSHRITRRKSPDMAGESGESMMVTYNDVMTVSQLIDLVAFVQSNYTLSPYTHSTYQAYWIPEPGGKKE